MRPKWLLLVCTALGLTACASMGTNALAAESQPSPADSVTVGLWHFDERSGPRVHDAGRNRLNGVAGPDSRVDFGRFKSARTFTATAQSFVVVPYNPVMESPRAFTVEAWVYLNALSANELSVIAARWSPTSTDQSWVLGVVGQKASSTNRSSAFLQAVAPCAAGGLVFAYRADAGGSMQRACSSAALPLRRWVQVAASVDGETVRIYVDGRQEAQVAVANGIRRSLAPLVIGNAVDPRRLTDVSGELKQADGASPAYALSGLVDELRLSTVARKTFESTGAK